MTHDEREQRYEARERRAHQYGIAPKDGGALTPPAGYPEDEEQYGDPVNYAYPIDEEHISPAIAYYNRAGQREAGGYTPEEWAIIGKRIAAAATRLLGAAYEYRDGKVVRVEEKAVKVLTDTDATLRIGGYAVVYGGHDLAGDTFTPATQLWFDEHYHPPVFYDHTMHPLVKNAALGRVVDRRTDDYGVWVEAELDRHNAYVEHFIRPLLNAGVLGFSSGSASHLVRRDNGVLTVWPIVEVSLTPTPCEPRTLGVSELRAMTAHLTIPVAGNDEPQEEPTMTTINLDEIADAVAKRLTPTTPHVGYAVPAPADDEGAAFKAWLRTGGPVRYAAKDITIGGGYVVPAGYYEHLIAGVRQRSAFREAGARVIEMPTLTMNIRTVSPMARAEIATEGGAFHEADPTVGNVTMTAYLFTRLTQVSLHVTTFSDFDVWRECLQPEFTHAFAAAENHYFTNGTGVAQPGGVLTGGTIAVTTASPTVITADEIIALYHALDYHLRANAVWMMHDSTAMRIRQLKDSTGQYLWQPGLTAGQPDRLLGRPVITNNAMPMVTAGAKVVVFGDFSLYAIGQHGTMTVQRLDELYAANGLVGFAGYWFLAGAVLMPAAFQILTMNAGS